MACASLTRARDHHNDSHVDDAGGHRPGSQSDCHGERARVHSLGRVHEPCHVHHTRDSTYISRDSPRSLQERVRQRDRGVRTVSGHHADSLCGRRE
jgi:hypothetical protein